MLISRVKYFLYGLPMGVFVVIFSLMFADKFNRWIFGDIVNKDGGYIISFFAVVLPVLIFFLLRDDIITTRDRIIKIALFLLGTILISFTLGVVLFILALSALGSGKGMYGGFL